MDWEALDEATRDELKAYNAYVAVASGAAEKEGSRISPQKVAEARTAWHVALSAKHAIAQIMADGMGTSRAEVIRRYYEERGKNEE